ncbi:hypothetical protein QQX09_04420 [Demequina sp. SYSU T00192]|uniref:Uncharacterized protein n=1 Tax=Demequina litoralis TaxID=3051660 RepID=A0ABT8G7K1_9MICO|nr:hypothetical protein [Demequina sp. SYSU T00192]MDN4475101.1 hypothetical protein [Demequina sp. SYSU T00192]
MNRTPTRLAVTVLAAGALLLGAGSAAGAAPRAALSSEDDAPATAPADRDDRPHRLGPPADLPAVMPSQDVTVRKGRDDEDDAAA